ncbi:hypothetical protein EMG21_28010 [Klebsiella pneumoniae]|nr:hypothetical protein EMG21_28010 [Klebsiella pneumoniae]
MAHRTETTRTNHSDGSVTTTTTTYDADGNVVSTSTSTASGRGSVVGIQAGSVSDTTVVVNGRRR